MEQYNKELEAVSIRTQGNNNLLESKTDSCWRLCPFYTQAAAAPLPDEDDADL